jgi:hypothetical protein
MQKADRIYFNELVKKYMGEDYTENQSIYLAYREMGLNIPDDIKKEVRYEEETLDTLGKYFQLKVQKKIKNNPNRRKYIISEASFHDAYSRHKGNYEQIASELIGSKKGGLLIRSVKNLSWWSIEKYPRLGTARKYFIEENEFKKIYDKHSGNYDQIANELIGSEEGGLLIKSVKNLSWWSIEKYPRLGTTRKYFIEEN